MGERNTAGKIRKRLMAVSLIDTRLRMLIGLLRINATVSQSKIWSSARSRRRTGVVKMQGVGGVRGDKGAVREKCSPVWAFPALGVAVCGLFGYQPQQLSIFHAQSTYPFSQISIAVKDATRGMVMGPGSRAAAGKNPAGMFAWD